MRKNRTFASLALVLFLVLSLAFSPKAYAGGGGNGDAKKGAAIPMVLTIVGVVTIGVGVAKIAAQQYATGALWVAGGVAEIIAAGMAGSNNSKTEEETRAQGEPAFDPAAPGGTPGSIPGLPDGINLEALCKQAGANCTCKGTNCSTPQITIPSLTDMQNALKSSYDRDPAGFPPGFSLDDALSKLDNEYGKAQEAIDAFNTASANGALSGKSMLADSGELQNVKDPKDLTSGKDRPNVGKSGEGTTNASADAMNVMNKDWFGKNTPGALKREPVRPVNRHGLTLEDARTGRLLTIFERVSRAIRADRDRDITLAKIEWARKELARKAKFKDRALATTQGTLTPDRK